MVQFKSLLNQPAIKHAISTRGDGSMKKEDLSVFHANLLKFGQAAGISSPIVCMNQIHSGNVAVVENNGQLVIPETDGMVTNKKKLPLAVITADCLPILLYDPHKQVIGVAHAGYKGLLREVIQKTIQKFTSEYASDPKDILIGIGPCIETMCYEVGEEVIEQFRDKYKTFENMFIKQDEEYYLDLRSVAKQILRKEGILEKHIEIMDVCTLCDKDFYSFRGGDKSGRFASVIGLV